MMKSILGIRGTACLGAWLISGRVMLRSRASRSLLPSSTPLTPAMLNHMCASMESFEDTPPLGITDPEVVLRSGDALLLGGGTNAQPQHSPGGHRAPWCT